MTAITSTSATGRDGAQDRRRAREERGLSSAGAGKRTDRLPPAPRERRPLLAALAVLLIVGGAAGAGLLAVRSDSRVSVLVAARDIAAGEAITADSLRTAQVASDSTLLIPESQRKLVVGEFARVSVSAGQLLDTTMVTAAKSLQPGKVAVGASLAVGRVPASGLEPGDVVQLVQVADGKGVVIVSDAFVSSARAPGTASTGSAGAITVTFFVDEAAGARVAGVASAGELAAVLVSRGAAIDGQG